MDEIQEVNVSTEAVPPVAHVARKGRRIPKGLLISGLILAIVCLTVLAIMLAPLRKSTIHMPVSNTPDPFLDPVLFAVEEKLKLLDKEKLEYPTERQLQSWSPRGVKLFVITEAPDILVLEVSRGDSVWRAMTHERNKPEATTFITVYKKPSKK